MTAIEYIRQKGIHHKVQAGQIVMNCPFCGETKGHFYMDQEEGVWCCHKCQEKGNLITLRKHFGDFERMEKKSWSRPDGGVKPAFDKVKTYKAPDEKVIERGHDALLKDPEALAYVTETRKIGVETVKRFRLGLEVDRSGAKWLMIPHYTKGKLVNIKYRSIPPAEKSFRRFPDGKSILMNQDTLEARPGEVIVTEGEMDFLTLSTHGIENAVATTTGAGSFDPEWIDLLKPVKKIILVYDPDEPGQKGAREAARRLGYDRCFNVVLPDGLDVNEFFQKHDVFDFQALVQKARRFDVSGIMSFSDGVEVLRKERQRPEQTGLKTGFPSVDRRLKRGFNPGELIVVSALPKIGKSSWVLQVIAWSAFQGIPALFFCLEMRPVRVIEKVVQAYCRRENVTEWDLDQTRRAYEDKPLYLGYSFQKPSLERIMDTLKQAVRRYGIKLLAFDHLHVLCRSLTNQTQEIGLAVQSFKFLAEELDIPVILIAQPRKVQDDRIMTAMDLKDSSSIYSDCDHLIILHRDRCAANKREKAGKDREIRDQAFDSVTLVRIEASRYNSGGEALLHFNGEFSRFDEIDGRYKPPLTE